MGSKIEINDTLKISKGRGFPEGLTLEGHVREPQASKAFLSMEFNFRNPDERLYHRPPTRVFLVEEMPDGKWLYWETQKLFHKQLITAEQAADIK